MDVGLIYILHDDASRDHLSIRGDLFKYLVKVRRHSVGETLYMRTRDNLTILYRYEIVAIDGRTLDLKLLDSTHKEVQSTKNLHIGWCVIDTKSIEKVLPSLSEIGVAKISFIHCERSQKNFKLDFKRFERILEASMQQCGRSSYIEFETYNSIQTFIKDFPDTKIFDFCDKTLNDYQDISTVLIGCEGGFSQQEKTFLADQDVFRLDTPMVLRSESAVMAVASKILL